MMKYDGYMMKITYEHNDYPMKHIDNQYNTYDQWLVVWNIFFPYILGMSSSQLTFIFFRGVETTNQIDNKGDFPLRKCMQMWNQQRAPLQGAAALSASSSDGMGRLSGRFSVPSSVGLHGGPSVFVGQRRG